MGFSEALKVKLRKRAHHACCICYSKGVEIHHIVPSSLGGDDSASNAAPLCPTCHERYGANREKRKLIVEARDNWFEICDKRFRSDDKGTDGLLQLLGPFAGESRAEPVPGQGGRTATLGEVLAFLYTHGFDGLPMSQSQADTMFEIFWQPGWWPGRNLGKQRRQFLQAYGTVTARRAMLHAIWETKLDVLEGFTEGECMFTLSCLRIEVLVLLDYLLPQESRQLAYTLGPDRQLRLCFAGAG